MVPKICSVPECNGTGYLTRGWCKMHYARWKRHGEVGTAEKQISVVSWAGVICKVSDCESMVMSSGCCNAHYKRFRRYGDPLIKRPTTPSDIRFCRNVAKRGPAECWDWTAAVGNHGYGIFHPIGKSTMLAHRYAYTAEHGGIPEGLHIDHLCRNRKCVNPSHLEAVTQKENSSRGLVYRLINGMDDSCINGHKYTPENTYTNPNKENDTRCRRCAANRDIKRRSKKNGK